MLCEKSILQNESVSGAHNECMIECYKETGALGGSYLAKKEQQDRSKDMLDNLPTMNTHFMCILRNRNHHYEAGPNWPQLADFSNSLIMSRSYSDYQFIKERNYDM